MLIPVIIIVSVILLIIIISAYNAASNEFNLFLLKNDARSEVYKKTKRNGAIIFGAGFFSIACIIGGYYAYTNLTDGTGKQPGSTVGVFSDVEGTWAEEAVTYLANEGIVSGIGDNMFGAQNNITRAEFVTMLVRMLETKMDVQAEITNVEGFNDVLEEKYYSSYLKKAKALGIASGYEGNIFKPDNTISRQDMFTFTERALNMLDKIAADNDFDIYAFYNDANAISAYAVPSIRNLTSNGIISGSNNMLRPLDLARRNEAAQMLYEVIKSVIDNPDSN